MPHLEQHRLLVKKIGKLAKSKEKLSLKIRYKIIRHLLDTACTAISESDIIYSS